MVWLHEGKTETMCNVFAVLAIPNSSGAACLVGIKHHQRYIALKLKIIHSRMRMCSNIVRMAICEMEKEKLFHFQYNICISVL